VSSNPIHGEVYSIKHYVIKFVSNLWQVGGFLWFQSDSTHHFFGNACTKSGSLRFSQFSGCWLILSVYILMSFDFPLEDCSEFGNFVITLISSTNKTDHYDITVKLLKVVLNTINQTKIKLVNNQEIILSQIQNSEIATPFIFIHKYLLQTKCLLFPLNFVYKFWKALR
jgi:hypothetical protein